MASRLPLTSRLCTPPAVKPPSFTLAATLTLGAAVRLVAVVLLASAVAGKAERPMRAKDDGSAAVSTVTNKDLLPAWKATISATSDGAATVPPLA